jgi:hypothetical protein
VQSVEERSHLRPAAEGAVRHVAAACRAQRDFGYFSLVTLATVGYREPTARPDLGIIAVTRRTRA